MRRSTRKKKRGESDSQQRGFKSTRADRGLHACLARFVLCVCFVCSHLFKVLKQIHPDVGISRKAMSVLNSFTMDIFQRLASEARTCCMELDNTAQHTAEPAHESEGTDSVTTASSGDRSSSLYCCRLHRIARHTTLSSRDMQTAVRSERSELERAVASWQCFCWLMRRLLPLSLSLRGRVLSLVIPGELAKHSVSEARKAMIKYADSVGKTSQGKAGKRLKDLD